MIDGEVVNADDWKPEPRGTFEIDGGLHIGFMFTAGEIRALRDSMQAEEFLDMLAKAVCGAADRRRSVVDSMLYRLRHLATKQAEERAAKKAEAEANAVEAPTTWRDRVKVERAELMERMDKLRAFLQTTEFRSLPESHRGLLDAQINAMMQYASLLALRLFEEE